MDNGNLLAQLSEAQKNSLKTGNFENITDILLSSPQEIAQKCRVTQAEAKDIIDTICSKATLPQLRRLEDVKYEGDERCTTGDSKLDEALEGGIRTGMVWEIAGESAAGKTQLALQISLFAQLPVEQGGLLGSTCYLTTSSTLPTSRLLQISRTHSILSSSSNCDLKDIHTTSVPTIPVLIHVLSQILPQFIKDRTRDQDHKPVKLLVIDALAELFHTSDKTTTNALVERSKNVSEVSMLLHALANNHQIAVLVLNEVVDVFEQNRSFDIGEGDLVYNDQARWFSQSNSIPGENKKEASLGLVWANQVNARILLSRTGRRRYLVDADNVASKRQKLNDQSQHNLAEGFIDDRLTLVRRLSVIFSSFSHPISLDYIVTAGGISILSAGETYPYANEDSVSRQPINMEKPSLVFETSQNDPRSQITPLDVGIAEGGRDVDEGVVENTKDVDPKIDEWDKYWAKNDMPLDV